MFGEIWDLGIVFVLWNLFKLGQVVEFGDLELKSCVNRLVVAN